MMKLLFEIWRQFMIENKKEPTIEFNSREEVIDYIKQNPRSTSQEFYMDVLGYPRPRGHNNMFFAFQIKLFPSKYLILFY